MFLISGAFTDPRNQGRMDRSVWHAFAASHEKEARVTFGCAIY
jgi:hypothetical protein